jgi:hypothetical protein
MPKPSPLASSASQTLDFPHKKHMAVSLSQKIRELKGLADEGELDGDDLEFIEHVDELTGNGGATLLSEAEARRVDELYRALGG